MTALIVWGSILTYMGLGVAMIPSIARWRYQKHTEGLICLFTDRCYSQGSHDLYRTCSARWASLTCIWWPVSGTLGFLRSIAIGALQKDVEDVKRVKQLEQDAKVHAAEQAKLAIRVRAEEIIRREKDVRTMSVDTFTALMESEIEKIETAKWFDKAGRLG